MVTRNVPVHARRALALVVSLIGCCVPVLGCGALAGPSPLRIAIENDDRAAYEKLLAEGADPNQIDSANYSPMHLAAGQDDPYWLRLALEHGGDPNLLNANAPRIKRGTPLHSAICAESLETVKLLVEAGADINHTGSGQTPLADAFATAAYDIVYYLLEQGADYNKNAGGETYSLVKWVQHRKPGGVPSEERNSGLRRIREWLTARGVQVDE
jgi:ankyrin repeat protein